ncbi:MAG: hypothetical protein J07HQW1_02130 [Haloquadratum walsbyi J07HQW1]|uniref:Uncharacterized protein n=1 Tax=Haloquadratum walsbyi J07HQW1 TaxID=1238424 RepID=U1N616_9EURY|nr:MAG: hypothetical protein J07HQW1_02130 [Haloquadratum walsbyi J07HQW1]
MSTRVVCASGKQTYVIMIAVEERTRQSESVHLERPLNTEIN